MDGAASFADAPLHDTRAGPLTAPARTAPPDPDGDRARVEALIERVALGDRAAFAALYDATAAKLFAVALRVLGDRQAAEDAMQDTFVKVWGAAGRYRRTGHSPMTWLVTIARNTAIDRLRARQGRPRGTDARDDAAGARVADGAPTPEQAAIARSEAGRVRDCLDALPPDRRAAITGAYLDGETYAALAERFDVPLNTMRTWLRRGLISLRACLGG